MDSLNFKKVFGNLMLSKKRENVSKINQNTSEEKNKNSLDEFSKNKESIDFINEASTYSKKYIKLGDIIEKKIKENSKKEDILKKFDDYDDKSNNIINKATESFKLKKMKYQEDQKKERLDKETSKEKHSEVEENNIKNENLELNENNELEKANNEKIIENSNVNIFSSDSEDSQNKAEERFSDNIACIPKEFQIDVSTKEWVVDVNPKKLIKNLNENGEFRRVIKLKHLSNDYKCDQLYIWFHKMFQLWEIDLDSQSSDFKKSPEGRQQLGIYKQCRGYIKPLLRLLKRREVTKEIINNLFEVMVFCIDKDYVRAHDKYIELAIGNAPWPMGVTMVGIHERSGRSRIFKSQVAHILNDDNTKKYLQSVKRIMSLVQRLNPTNPSNSVFS